MKILLVEDDENKASRVKGFLVSLLETRNDFEDVVVCRSYNSGLRALSGRCFAFVILDMTLPTFDNADVDQGGLPRPFGGQEIMEELLIEGISVPVIVVTGFDVIGEGTERMTLGEVESNLSDRFPEIFCGVVHYSSSESEWREDLRRIISEVLSDGQH